MNKKYTKLERRIKEEALKEWINTVTVETYPRELLAKLEEEGFSAVQTLESMRTKDLELVLCMIKAVYHLGALNQRRARKMA